MSSSSSLSQIPCSYATASAGMHLTHTLSLKLQAIADAGFKYAEVAFPDLEALASFTFNGEYKQLDEKGEGDVSKLVDTAIEVNKICGSLGLKVLTVMPFPQFEGYTDAEKKENSLNRARTMFKVLHGLGCDMLQVGSTNDPSTSGDYDIIAKDLRELADEAAKQNPPIRIAYEMWAWGVHANSWEHTWDICKRVDRSNFGLCLDTFQISAIYYASKLSNNISTPYPLPPLPAPSLADSLTSLVDTLKPQIDKIFYLQISDAVFPPASSAFSMPPSTGVHELNAVERAAKEKDVHVLYAWSDSWRPLPFHKQVRPDAEGIREGILPVLDICRAVLRTGWRGPWSYEVFYADSQSKEDPDIPRRWTEDAMKAHELILEALQDEGF